MGAAALLCLSMAIYHEARSEPIKGQVAVASVVLNRVNSPRYLNDVCSVVTQRGQFPFYWGAPRDNRAWETAVQIAEKALAGDVVDPTGGAMHYHSLKVKPGWTRGMQSIRIANHIFWR